MNKEYDRRILLAEGKNLNVCVDAIDHAISLGLTLTQFRELVSTSICYGISFCKTLELFEILRNAKTSEPLDSIERILQALTRDDEDGKKAFSLKIRANGDVFVAPRRNGIREYEHLLSVSRTSSSISIRSLEEEQANGIFCLC